MLDEWCEIFHKVERRHVRGAARFCYEFAGICHEFPAETAGKRSVKFGRHFGKTRINALVAKI